MKNLLHIVSSARGNQSFSYGLSSAIVKKLRAKNEVLTVVEKNLTKEPPPLIDETLIRELYMQPGIINQDGKQLLNYSNKIFNEVQEAEIIVIGTPMHNLGVSAHLKAWIDQFIRMGKTYKYTNDWTRIGLLKGKKIYLAIASGAIFSKEDHENEFIETYIKAVFSAYAGITDINTYRVDGTAYPNFKENYEGIIQDL